MSDEKVQKPASDEDPEFWLRPARKWMWDAAYHIDSEVGLARFDLAVQVAARIIAKHNAEAQNDPAKQL